MTNTIAVVIMVSFRDGQVTLEASFRTCWRNSNGFVFAILCHPGRRAAAGRPLSWRSGEHPTPKLTGARSDPPRATRLEIRWLGAAIHENARPVDPLAGVEGLEPPTPGFGDRCSSRLSYTPLGCGPFIWVRG